MSTELTPAIVPTENENFQLSATTPEEMVRCHHAAIDWCKRKIKLIAGEAKELKEAYEHALSQKWKVSVLKRHWELAAKRVVFYQKMLGAFEAGFLIVPNFPVTLFAIRTDKPTPKRLWARLRSERSQNFEQKPALLPAGEGEYQNPLPIVESRDHHKDDKGNDTWAFEATDWNEMDFPVNMSKLHIMEAATKAMDAKIFDEVGFLPQDYKRNPDPLLIGRIIDPRPMGYGEQRRVSFMIAWAIDTKTL